MEWIDGNWAAAITAFLGNLLLLAFYGGRLSARLTRCEDSLSRRVSEAEYKTANESLSKRVARLDSDLQTNNQITRDIGSKVDQLTGKIDVLIQRKDM